MNMIVNTSDLVGYEAETEENKKAARKASLSKILAAWESKQASKAKKYGSLGFLAVSLAACNTETADDNSGSGGGGGSSSSTAAAAQSFTLTKTVDQGASFVGSTGDDTFMGAHDGTNASWTVADSIDGGAGTDTLKIVKTAAVTAAEVSPTGATAANIENVEVISGAGITAGTTSSGALSGVTSISLTGTNGVTITAGATQDVTITDSGLDTAADGGITTNGGKNVTVTATADDAATDGDGNAEISVNETTGAKGAISVTHTGKYADGGNNTLSTIQTGGGTSVSLTQNASITAAQASAALTDNTNFSTTMGAMQVTGTADTTSVTITQTAAQAETDATDGSGQVGIVGGAVTIFDVNEASTTAAGVLTTVSVTNAASVDVQSGALTSITLGGKIGGAIDLAEIGNLTTVTNKTLGITAASLTGGGTTTVDTDIENLNLTSTGTKSTFNALTANGVKALTSTGDAQIVLTGHTMNALTSVAVTGSGGLSMVGTALPTTATFSGSAGKDGIQVGAHTTAITMGAGDDTVVYGGALGTGGSVAGGDGTDTVSMTFAQANAADASAVFNTSFTSFEAINFSDAITGALDMDALNNATLAVLAAGSNNGTLNNLDSGSTVHIKADNAGALTINVQSAVVNANDSLNIKMDKTGVLANNTVTSANVETITIDMADTAATGGAAAINTGTFTFDKATSITITGNNGLNGTYTGSVAVTNFDASAITGNSTTASAGTAATTDTAANLAVTYVSLNSTSGAAVTIKGGDGNDTLSGEAGDKKNVDNITGGKGDDTITGESGADILDGGANSATGFDTVSYAEMDAATDHGLTGVSGMAVNLSAADVTASTVASAMGGNVVLGGGAGVAGSTLTAGSVGYLATSAAASLATMVRDTVSNFEKVITGNLSDYIETGSGNDTIMADDGADYIKTGAGQDNILYEAADDGGAADATNVAANALVGADTIVSFAAGASGDKFTFTGSVFGSTGANATTLDVDNIAGAANGGTNTGLVDVTANTEMKVIVHQTDLGTHANLETFMDTTAGAVLTDATCDMAIFIVGVDAIDTAVGAEHGLVIFDPNLGNAGDHVVLGSVGALDLSTLTADNFAVA